MDLCVGSLVVTGVIYAGTLAWCFREEIGDAFCDAINKFKRKEELPDVEYVEDEA